MRPFEIALLVANGLTLFLLLIPRARRSPWPVAAAGVAVLAAVIQVAAEGARWQMIPAYAMAVLLLVAALRLRRPPPLRRRSLGRRLAIVGTIALAAIGTTLSVALPAGVPMFQFPTPTGPYAIGTLTYHWVDEDRPDFGDPSAPRELMVQIWYPADASAGGTYDTYIQAGMHLATLEGGMPIPGFFLNHLKDVHTHALLSARMAPGSERFPVLIFSPGAQGFRQHNTFQVEELVSHGYVVAGIDHPRAAREVVFPDGHRTEFDPQLVDVPRFMTDPDYADRTFNYLAGDVSFALDRIAALDAADPNGVLTGRLDTDREGMFGVSLGGLVAAEACRTDARLKACLIQDVFVPQDVVAAGVQQPTMWLTRGPDAMRAEGWPQWEVDLHQSTMRAAFAGTRTDGYMVQIPGMFHLNYTDFPYTVAPPVGRGVRLMGPIDWRRGHAIVNAYTLAFFDRHLRGEPALLLEGPTDTYPEVHLEARHR